MKKLRLITVLSFATMITNSQTLKPDIITTSGGYFASSMSSLSWTIGEPIIDTYSGPDKTLTQGFQQSSYNITTGIENITDNSTISVFPNPSSNIINVKWEQNTSMFVELYDLNGKVMIEQTSSLNTVQLDVSALSDGIYLLKVMNTKEQKFNSYKIEKIN